MENLKKIALFGAISSIALAGNATAENPDCPCEDGSIVIDSDITEDTTWDASEVYCISERMFVREGATLTIPAGTQVRSSGGAMIVVRGSQIFVNGTAAEPVVMTSACETGFWRESANEWGNLTIMGNGVISASHFNNSVLTDSDGNPVPLVPDGTAERRMEGLAVGDIPDDSFFGGNDDDDDSGSISYLSIRYGGNVLGFGDELNGLALGGVGRNTEIHHFDMMNNVDDGIEIWGGTVNVKYINLWNAGDDSFDLDSGWRGKAQFLFIVQGYALDAGQGSGVGDNIIEADGAERGDAQPVLTSTVYNVTGIGQPDDGDFGVALRDNARLQIRNAVFMDVGDDLIQNDGAAGEGGGGYGGADSGVMPNHLSWSDTWATLYTVLPTTNAGVDNGDCSCSPASLYTAQSEGVLGAASTLLEVTDSVFFNIADLGEADDVDVDLFAAGKFNTIMGSTPISGIARAGAVVKGGKVMRRVLWIDPTPVGIATDAEAVAPDDGFYDQADYRGAFSPAGPRGGSWIDGWTTAAQYGFIGPEPCLSDLDGNGSTDLGDLLAVLSNWGDNYFGGRPADADNLPGDVDRNEVVGLADLLAVLSAWGDCP